MLTARPFSNLENSKVKEAIPGDVLTKPAGKINVKSPAKESVGRATTAGEKRRSATRRRSRQEGPAGHFGAKDGRR
jgi:hypothetical protein